MEQRKRLLISILVSSLITNVILIGAIVASLIMVSKVKDQVDDATQRLERLHQIVEGIKASRGTVKEKIRERRRGETTEEDGAEVESTRRSGPLKRRLRKR